MVSGCSVGGWVGGCGSSVFLCWFIVVVVAADLVCERYSMVYSCVFSGAALWGLCCVVWGWGWVVVLRLAWLWSLADFHGFADFGLFVCWRLDLCDLGVWVAVGLVLKCVAIVDLELWFGGWVSVACSLVYC